jgi:hypothetical protein
MRLRKPGSRASRASRPDARERSAKRAEERRPAAKPAGRREAATDRAGTIASVAKRSAVELTGIARELVRIPAALYMRIAERAGGWVLAAWLLAWPYLVRVWHLAGRALRWAQRVVTPARVTVAVALLTAVALAGSQWADLSAVSTGVEAYQGLEDVVTAPEVTTKTVGDAHAWVGVPLAVLAILVIIGSFRGRPGLARLLIPIGIAVIAISLLVDRPEGLDQGNDAVAYQSVRADLLPGFWAQLVSGGVLILLALVLTRVLRPERTPSPKREGSARAKGGVLGRLRPRGLGRTAEAGR